jgi:hypothetical protein
MTTSHDALVERYLGAWNATDPTARLALVAAAWCEQGRYRDPALAADGHAAIAAMVEAVQQRFPEHEFRRTGGIDAHDDRLRFGWELAPRAGGAPAVRGVDFAELGPDGRLARVTGFFDA